MNSSFLATYFGPLKKSNCIYFYIFSLLGFLVMSLSVFMLFASLIYHYKKMTIYYFLQAAVSFLNVFISAFLLYFSNRLLNTICMKVL